MKLISGFIIALVLLIGLLFSQNAFINTKPNSQEIPIQSSYWLLLYRKSNIEFLYHGTPGESSNSLLLKVFRVKSGIPGEQPTPLPQLLGRKYWLVVEKKEAEKDSETSPYFLTLDIPVTDGEPYGPLPYLECNGQCNWNIPGSFGLHGINGNLAKLSNQDPGSSGCIRHNDKDITYLYNILDPKIEEIRYYIEDM